jgi:hypothetical protein
LVQLKKDGLKLGSTQQHLVYTDDVNIFVENTDAFIVASKKSGLEVMADKAKYMILFRDQNGGRNRHIKIHNNSFEIVEH